MTNRQSSKWLHLAEQAEGLYIHNTRRLHHISQQLASPQTQLPSMIVFLGNKHKDTALRALFPDNTILSRQPYLQLDVDSRTTFAEHPMLFSHFDLNLELRNVRCDFDNCENIQFSPHIVGRYRGFDILLNRTIFLFTDVICIFADDIGGLDAVRALLTRWALVGRNASSLDYRPRILIVLEPETGSITHELLDESDFLFSLMQDRNISEVFATPVFHRLSGKPLSNVSQHCSLKDDLFKLTDFSRRDRRQDCYLFSTTHMATFFELSLHHTSQAPQVPLDFIRIDKGRPEISQSHSYHLRNFLVLTKKRGWTTEAQAAIIASALLVDAYPPGSHSK
ncbi:uncharacterized protein BP01DRAFT_233530 [Aspergillus saccharolyticus JOP 1030-1]|uniref:Uncharacterized protein n=1 Tax=Aspergillus saccharolyticus JOP 1030-1 TaxID=1450539 RepID=A0A318YZF8_9EURO|nr:hypothetical protein BP01DRAFT_233530 [Aspergillus saccharolyticus JOP 1030-1]PYH40086.1 hypothetical protein BP01DRAFT_233530 [Aspergillus saccharolyticus JOP 1030-1]